MSNYKLGSLAHQMIGKDLRRLYDEMTEYPYDSTAEAAAYAYTVAKSRASEDTVSFEQNIKQAVMADAGLTVVDCTVLTLKKGYLIMPILKPGSTKNDQRMAEINAKHAAERLIPNMIFQVACAPDDELLKQVLVGIPAPAKNASDFGPYSYSIKINKP